MWWWSIVKYKNVKIKFEILSEATKVLVLRRKLDLGYLVVTRKTVVLKI